MPHNPATAVKALLLIITTSFLNSGVREHWSQAPGNYSGEEMAARPGMTKATYPVVFTIFNRVSLEHLPPKLTPV
jgi:hypothetical protein